VEARRRRYPQAMARLLEIAIRRRQYDWTNNQFGRLPIDSLSEKQRADLLYLQGKALFQQDRFDESTNLFSRVPASAGIWAQAQYFLAVIALKTKPRPQNLQSAASILEKAVGTLPEKAASKTKKLRDTLLIALGRLYLEESRYPKALAYYKKIDKTSAIFDEAVYEMSWAYIRRGRGHKEVKEREKDYDRALKSLSLILDFLPDSAFFSKAQLLRGQLLLELNQFSPAMENYNKVVKQYSAVYRDLNQIKNSQIDIEKELLRAATAQREKKRVTSVLPKEAVQGLTEDEMIQRVLVVQRDLVLMKQYLDESQRIISRLERALGVQERILISPDLRQARLQALALQNQQIAIQADANRLEQDLVLQKMSGSERTRYEDILRQIKTLDTSVQRAPQSTQALAQRDKAFRTRTDEMNTRLHKLTLILNQLEREEEAGLRWLQRNPDAQQLTPQARNEIQQNLTQIRQDVKTLRAEKKRLEQEVETTAIELGYATDPQEQQSQQRYQALLNQQKSLLQGLQGRLSGEESTIINALQSLRDSLLSAQQDLNRFNQQTNRSIVRYTKTVRSRLQEEKIKITGYRQQMDRLQSESVLLSRAIIYDGFDAVKKSFYKLILQADVGIIDVVWKEKQTLQEQSQKLARDRNSELRVIDSEFRDLLEEVK
jgi:tetratricopeptide (TPR) repeat protein